ncbi:MAG: hypothetical protein JSU01_23905 [Bacteroidetes bacterium]|nr:hypothetical protein [Bacteroidota bacterium]
MKIFMLLAFCFWLSAAKAQQVIVDPQHTASVVENGIVRNSAESAHINYLGKINKDLDNININVGSVVLAQNMIYNALANVNSALKDGLAAKNLVVVIGDMLNYLHQCLELAKSQPWLLLVASNIEQQLQARALLLVGDVSGFILNANGSVLTDYNSRDQLLHKVTQELQIMDSLAYGAWRAMFWAKERGVIATLNPFAAWINQDKALVSRIITNAKYLHQ